MHFRHPIHIVNWLFSIGMLSIPNLMFKSLIFLSMTLFADKSPVLLQVSVDELLFNHNSLVITGIKSFTNKSNITVALSIGTTTKSICMLSKTFITSGDNKQSLCLFVYILFVKYSFFHQFLL